MLPGIRSIFFESRFHLKPLRMRPLENSRTSGGQFPSVAHTGFAPYDVERVHTRSRLYARISTIICSLILIICLIVPSLSFADDSLQAVTSSPASSTSSVTGGASGVVADASDSTSVDVSDSRDAAIEHDATFGISDFSRLNKGTNKTYGDTYYGYRYAMVGADAFAVIVANGYAIVYVPQTTLDEFGINLSDSATQQTLINTLVSIDSAAAHGGQTLSELNPTYYFTSDTSYVVGDYTYAFNVEVEEGYYYATATLAGSDDGSGGGLYALSGNLTAASGTTIATKTTGFAALQEFFSTLDWRPLWVSLRTTGVAIIFVFILGLIAAWATIKVNDRFKGILDTVFTVPMVLPPTVCGFLLLLLFGNSTDVGRWLIAHGINLVFTWPAAVIACTVVAFPLMYRTTRGAFESLDETMLDAARTLGWSEPKVFTRLMVPMAWPSIAAGTVLAFARAMGEFGATLFFAGNYAGVTQTIPIAIYFDWMGGQTDAAIFWVIVVILISFLVILFINIYSSHTQKYRRKGNVESDR
jgi:molybdate transport system permease protein